MTKAKQPETTTEVQLFADGACSGNPGPGGWAFVLRHPASGKELQRSGGERETTNNRMEMTAVIRGLEALKRPSRGRGGHRQRVRGQGAHRVAAEVESQRLAPPRRGPLGDGQERRSVAAAWMSCWQSTASRSPTSAATRATSKTSAATPWPSPRTRSIFR